MEPAHNLRRPWLALLVAVSLGVIRPAEALQAEFRLPAERAGFAPRDPLVVALADVSPERLDRLRLELDAFDVTDVVEVAPSQLVYRPVEPLAPGTHELRLVEYSETGEAIERGRWRFEVRQEATATEHAYRVALEGAAQRRVSTANLSPPPAKTVTQASLELDSQWRDARYQFNSRLGGVYDGSVSGDPAQLTDLLLSAGDREGRNQVQLGQHALPGDSLIRQGFLRRGLSVGIRRDSAWFGAYAQNTRTQAGFDDPLGLARRDRLTEGMAVQYVPWPETPRRLVLRGEWLRSRGGDEGAAELGDEAGTDSAAGGDAWMVAADTYRLQGRLRLYGEYARSRFDYDGSAGVMAPYADSALQFFAQYVPPPQDALEWNAGLHYRQIGSFFRSLANPGLPGDRRSLVASAQVRRGGLETAFSAALERDNVNGLADLPVVESRVLQARLRWMPETPGAGGWFANPSYSLDLAWTANRQIADGAGFSGTPTDNRSQDLYFAAAFAPGSWRWSVDYRHNRFDDRAGAQADTRDDLLGLALELPVGEAVYLGPSLQIGRARDRHSGAERRDQVLGLSASLSLDTLSGSLEYSDARYVFADGGGDSRTRTLGLMLAYQVREARGAWAGLQFFVNANWSEAGPETALARQIYLGIRTGLARSGG